MRVLVILAALCAGSLGAGPAAPATRPAAPPVTQPSPTVEQLWAAETAAELRVTKSLEKNPAYVAAMSEVAGATVKLEQARAQGEPAAAALALATAKGKLQGIREATLRADSQYAAAHAARVKAQAAPKAAAPVAEKRIAFDLAIARLPKEARPDPGTAWDEFSLPAANKTLRQQLDGKEVELVSPLSSVAITRIADPQKKDETLGWVLDVKVQAVRAQPADPLTFVFSANKTSGGWHGGSYRVEVSEAVAKNARYWRPGHLIRVYGVFDDVDGRASQTTDGEADGVFTILLKDCKVEWIGVPPPPVKMTVPDPEVHPIIPRHPR